MAIFPEIGYHRPSAAARRGRPRARSRLALRLRVARHHDALDDALSRGADPRSRPELALRAAQLEQMRHRRVLARTLRRVIAEALAAPASAQAQPLPIQRGQVRTDLDDLVALADRLAFPQPVAGVAGIAIARRLITDGLTSPLYTAREPHTLRRIARHALGELGPMD